MATSSPDREVDFTTIRITKRDKRLLEQLALPKECAWETFRRIAQAAAITGIKKKEKDNYKGMSPKYKRAIRSIERCFTAYRKQGVHQVSFAQIKDWVNQNSREGVSSPTLSNFLRRRPQFHLVRKDRRHGTNEIQGFWAMEYDDGSPIEKGTASPGWVEVPIETDTGI
tara:strand:+ start:491 stop:997 length:507 start_codon:yes stop_codon:yes gene_type:complete